MSGGLSLFPGVPYQRNGQASYVPEGGVTRNADGSLNTAATTGDANLVSINLGIAEAARHRRAPGASRATVTGVEYACRFRASAVGSADTRHNAR